MFLSNRILVPVDLSDHSAAALRHGLFCAQHAGAKLDVLHAVEVEPTGDSSPVLTAAEAHLRAWIQDTGAPLAAMAQIHVVPGDPVPAILRSASGYDLIVMGSRGAANGSRSVATIVSRCAPCRVVTITAAGDDDAVSVRTAERAPAQRRLAASSASSERSPLTKVM